MSTAKAIMPHLPGLLHSHVNASIVGDSIQWGTIVKYKNLQFADFLFSSPCYVAAQATEPKVEFMSRMPKGFLRTNVTVSFAFDSTG